MQLAPVFILFFSLNSYAGTSSGGGADGVAKKLFDFAEGESLEKINDVTKLPAYIDLAEPLLKNLDQRILGITDLLKLGLKKKWHFSLTPLDCSPNQSALKMERNTVACQDEFDVFLWKAWYMENNVKQQAGAIIHELVRSVHMHTQKRHKPIRDEDIRGLTRIIFSLSSHSSDEINDFLVERGFGEFMSREDMETFYKHLSGPLCSDNNNPWNESEAEKWISTKKYFRYAYPTVHLLKKISEILPIAYDYPDAKPVIERKREACEKFKKNAPDLKAFINHYSVPTTDYLELLEKGYSDTRPILLLSPRTRSAY